MTPTSKGNYKQCDDCKHKTNTGDRYPCTYSHSKVRGDIKYERDFRICLLWEAKP